MAALKQCSHSWKHLKVSDKAKYISSIGPTPWILLTLRKHRLRCIAHTHVHTHACTCTCTQKDRQMDVQTDWWTDGWRDNVQSSSIYSRWPSMEEARSTLSNKNNEHTKIWTIPNVLYRIKCKSQKLHIIIILLYDTIKKAKKAPETAQWLGIIRNGMVLTTKSKQQEVWGW